MDLWNFLNSSENILEKKYLTAYFIFDMFNATKDCLNYF